jgi:hypothetical protein
MGTVEPKVRVLIRQLATEPPDTEIALSHINVVQYDDGAL